MQPAWLLAVVLAGLVAPDVLPWEPGVVHHIAQGAQGVILFSLLATRPGWWWRVVCALGVVVQASIVGCGLVFDVTAPTSAVCDYHSGRPLTAGVCAVVALVACGIYDKIQGGRGG